VQERCANWPSVVLTPLTVRESLILLAALLPKDVDSGFVDLIAAQLGSEQLRSPAIIQAFGRFFAHLDGDVDRTAILHDLLSAGAAGGAFEALLSRLPDYCRSRSIATESETVYKVGTTAVPVLYPVISQYNFLIIYENR
jgi:hypothetical protein